MYGQLKTSWLVCFGVAAPCLCGFCLCCLQLACSLGCWPSGMRLVRTLVKWLRCFLELALVPSP